MTTSRLLTAALLGLALGAVPSAQMSFGGVPKTSHPHVQRLTIGFEPGADASIVGLAGGLIVDSYGDPTVPMSLGGPGQVVVTEWPGIGRGQAPAALLATAVATLPGVLFAEPVTRAAPPEAIPCTSTPGAQQCTAAFFDGAPSLPKYSDQPAVSALAVDSATQGHPSAATRVAVIDTGIDPTHPLLVGRVEGLGYDFIDDQPGGFDWPNGVDDDLDGVVDEAHGHGTHIAGLAVLLDPQARILPYRVLDAEGWGDSYDVAAAVYRAVEDGASIINLSLSLDGHSTAVEEAIDHASEANVVVFASAGNTGGYGVAFPSSYEGAIGVAASDQAGVLADFSAYGPEVDLVAPGIDLYSAMPGGKWAWWSGTSMSTAVASGATSRLMSMEGWFSSGVGLIPSADTVVESIAETAVPLDAMNPGYTDLLGSGLIDVLAGGLDLLSEGCQDEGDDCEGSDD